MFGKFETLDTPFKMYGADVGPTLAGEKLAAHHGVTVCVETLRRWMIAFHHFRDRDDFEVDIVLERAGRRSPASRSRRGATVTAADFRGLRKLRERAGARFVCGVVLYGGVLYGGGLYAVPVRAPWET